MELAKQLAEAKKAVRRKFRTLQQERFDIEQQTRETYQPLITPLEKIAQESQEPSTQLPSVKTETPKKQLTEDNEKDHTYGPKLYDGNWYLNDNLVYRDKNNIKVGNKSYKFTKGLWDLIWTWDATPTNADEKNYKKILTDTKVYLNEPPSGKETTHKYASIIKPLREQIATASAKKASLRKPATDEPPTTGSGVIKCGEGRTLPRITNTNPNKLCYRLRLLVASKSAGHTGLEEEIDSIINELRRRDIIE